MHLLSILLSLALLAASNCTILGSGRGGGSWGPSGCSAVAEFAPPLTSPYAQQRPDGWHQSQADADQFDLWQGGRHVGSWNRDGRYMSRDGAGQWHAAAPPVAPPEPERGAAPVQRAGQVGNNFGVEVGRLDNHAPPTYRGQPITRQQAMDLVGGPDVPDNRTKRRLTVIGPDACRKPVVEALRGPLAPLCAECVLADYPPDHWAVAKVGFVTKGSPTIYLQEPDGKVVFRLDSADGLKDALASAVRKPGPYTPDNDPNPLKPGPLAADGELPWSAGLVVIFLVVCAAVGVGLACGGNSDGEL